MAEQMRPASPQQAPDPSFNYERSHPEREPGMGRLDNNTSTPEQSADKQDAAVTNKQEPEHQINAQDESMSGPGRQSPAQSIAERQALPPQPDHSMKDEEPHGWDQAPTDIHTPEHQRHPRPDGKGGTH